MTSSSVPDVEALGRELEAARLEAARARARARTRRRFMR